MSYLLVFLFTGSKAFGLEPGLTTIEVTNSTYSASSTFSSTLANLEPVADRAIDRSIDLLLASKTKATRAGTIQEVRNRQVWVVSANQKQRQRATAGMELNVGDIVQTKGNAMAQIQLASGITFRVGGNSTTIIQPDRTMRLTAGEALIWAKPGEKVNTQVYGKRAVASIRGTTIHVKVEDDCVFSVWEGSISLKLEKSPDAAVILNTGEQVRVATNVEVMKKFTSDVETIAADRFRQKLADSPLLNDFSTPIDTQAELDRVVEQTYVPRLK
ncbi:FecR domain-containing protein [Thalassoporum mexicanum]|uniref:FecR domain-containing protein n=1 Tax=Thalassoporum mexicanum TaxID=3457544 RepID=UPI0002DAFFDA|nr:FecR domain-containing protein [Pseudanabaena sp. PCC 7367]